MMDRLVDHVRESCFVKLQYYILHFRMLFWDGNTHHTLEVFIEINILVRYKGNIGTGEFHYAIESLVGDVVAMMAFLQSNQEPTVVVLFQVIRMDNRLSLITGESFVEN